MNCPICDGPNELQIQSIPGYQKGLSYQIYTCQKCHVSSAAPLEVDQNIYNLIYANAASVPGYDRYQRYAEDVSTVRRPLSYLSEVEDTYWGVRQTLKNHPDKAKGKIIEVGSGLGYLTYSLVNEGYDCVGIDISQKAVDAATNMYGEYYKQADLFEFTQQNKEVFDVVVMTEVIEHVPNPEMFLKQLALLTKTGGIIMVSTPLKPSKTKIIWGTELPPVHLWWYTQESFQVLAEKLHMSVYFVDFALYEMQRVIRTPAVEEWRTQTFDEDGNILFMVPFSRIRWVIRRWMIEQGLMQAIKRLIARKSPQSSSLRLMGIFTKL